MMETDATKSDELNEDEAIIDEDASSIDTMNGWNALKEMLEQGSSGDDDLDDNESIASNLMMKEESNRGEDGIKEGEEIEEDDNDGVELGKGRDGCIWTNGGEDQQSTKADKKEDEEKEEKYLYRRALRIASWNIGNGYREEPIVELLVGKEIDYLVHQEPIMPKGTSEDTDLQVGRATDQENTVQRHHTNQGYKRKSGAETNSE